MVLDSNKLQKDLSIVGKNDIDNRIQINFEIERHLIKNYSNVIVDYLITCDETNNSSVNSETFMIVNIQYKYMNNFYSVALSLVIDKNKLRLKKLDRILNN